MVKGASGNLQKEKIINKRKHAGRRPIGIKYFEARMVYRLQNFLPYIWFFFLRKAKNTVFWAKTVFEGWLAPTLFLVLSLVSTVCGFGRKILHKMTDISSLISKLWHSDSPVSNSLSRTIRRTVRHHCCHHIAGRILQLLKLSSIYRCRRCHSSNFRSICRSNPCDIYL